MCDSSDEASVFTGAFLSPEWHLGSKIGAYLRAFSGPRQNDLFSAPIR